MIVNDLFYQIQIRVSWNWCNFCITLSDYFFDCMDVQRLYADLLYFSSVRSGF